MHEATTHGERLPYRWGPHRLARLRAVTARSGRLWWPLAATLLILAPLLHLLPLLWLIWERSFDVPFWDEWTNLHLVREVDEGTLGVDDFWRYQSVHRIVVTRVISLGIIELTDWHRQVHMTFGLVVTLGTVALLLAGARRTLPSPRAALVLIVPFTVLLFSFGQARSWLQPFLIAFLTLAFSVALSTWALAHRDPPPWRLALAITGAVVASLSALAGLIAWVAFLPAVWRTGSRRLAIWIGAALAVIIPYAIGFPTDRARDHDAASPLDAPLPVVEYALAYLGAPIDDRDVARAQLFALLGISLTLANLLVFWWRRGQTEPLLPWSGLALFVLGCTGITALGRGDFDTVQALSPRYQPISALWWVIVIIVAALALGRLVATRRTAGPPASRQLWWGALGVNVVALLFLGAGLVATNIAGYRDTSEWLALRRLNQPCILDYAHASKDCTDLYNPRTSQLREGAAYLAQHRLALFRDAEPLDVTRLPALPQSTEGAFAAVGEARVPPNRRTPIAVPAGVPLLVTGWARDAASGRVAGGVVIVVDDREHFWASYGIPRPRLAAKLGTAAAEGGYEATLPAAVLPPGRHTLTLKVVTPDLAAHYTTSPAQRVEIEVR